MKLYDSLRDPEVKKMTKAEFDQLNSDGRVECPKCRQKTRHPHGGCGCPSRIGGYGTRHINLYHHTCPEPSKSYDALDDPEVQEHAERLADQTLADKFFKYDTDKEDGDYCTACGDVLWRSTRVRVVFWDFMPGHEKREEHFCPGDAQAFIEELMLLGYSKVSRVNGSNGERVELVKFNKEN